MKKISYLCLALLFVGRFYAQPLDTLYINYHTNYPFAYEENGQAKGIEVEIAKEYANWLKAKKNINLIIVYKPYSEFDGVYSTIKSGNKKAIGLGSATISSEREKEVDFSPAYMRNVAVLVTDGSAPTLKAKSDLAKFSGFNAVTIEKTSFSKYLNELKKTSLPSLKITSVKDEQAVLETITKNPKTFGYVDIVPYWNFVKKNPSKFLKIQKVLNQSNEYFGFILPKNGLNKDYLNEFFESGFGFTSTKAYHQILENYLSYEILQSVEVN